MKRNYGTLVRLLRDMRGVRRTTRLFAAVFWMGLIFFASSLPGSATGPDTLLWNLFLKALHFMNFGVLSLAFLSLVAPQREPSAPPRAYGISFCLTTLYAISDEYHQMFSPGRHASVRDVIIDAAGAGIFLAACYLVSVARTGTGQRTKKAIGQ